MSSEAATTTTTTTPTPTPVRPAGGSGSDALSIPVGVRMTEDQQRAYDTIIQDCSRGGAIHIDGGAGSGKSFLIEQGEVSA
jgi:hypothetical protein